MKTTMETRVSAALYKRPAGDVIRTLEAIQNKVDEMFDKMFAAGVKSQVRVTVSFTSDGHALIYLEGDAE